MCWAGEEATPEHISNAGQTLTLREARDRAVTELRHHGIEHMDARDPNFLWNAENKRVMLIDFERSRVLENVRKRALEEIGENENRKGMRVVRPEDRGASNGRD